MKRGIRQAVVAELKRQGINSNQLAAMVAARIHRSHVYDFVAGRKDLSTEKASHLLHVLGLVITAKKADRN